MWCYLYTAAIFVVIDAEIKYRNFFSNYNFTIGLRGILLGIADIDVSPPVKAYSLGMEVSSLCLSRFKYLSAALRRVESSLQYNEPSKCNDNRG